MFGELDPVYKRLRDECRDTGDPYKEGAIEKLEARIREQEDRMATLLTLLVRRRVFTVDEAISAAGGVTLWEGEHD